MKRPPTDDKVAVTANSVFSGITTFARLPWVQCLGKDKDTTFDIAFIGAPFVRTKSSMPVTFGKAAAHPHVRTPAHPTAPVHALVLPGLGQALVG